jgi:AraC-like DNA-binding protein
MARVAFPPRPVAPDFDPQALHAVGDPRTLFDLFDHLPRVYLYVKDRKHRYLKVNRSELILHGLNSESEMLGRSDLDFHPPALAMQYMEEDRLVFESKQPVLDRAWLVLSADGTPGWYLSTKIPLFDAKGEVIGLAGVMRPYDHAADAPGGYQRLTRAIDFVLQNYRDPITVEEMAKRAHLSVSQLRREFVRLFGLTPGEYILKVRLLMARQRLEQTSEPVGNIAHECGFYDQSHFNRAFRGALGIRPLEYRRRFGPEQRRG